jgi:hypothetical protein
MRVFRFMPSSSSLFLSSLVIISGALACGSGNPSRPEPEAPFRPPEPPPSALPVASATAPGPTATPGHLPAACADAASTVCAPPGEFVERLCAKPLQDVALALFAKETPFTRLYLKGKFDELGFDEEVLALRFHGPQKGGMVVGSGNGTYDLLRWDGTCSRGVEAEMIGRTRPGRPRSAHVQWHRIGSTYQDALIAGSDAVKRAHARRGKECQGAMSGDVSRACEGADEALADAVVDFVRTHGGLPEPGTIP